MAVTRAKIEEIKNFARSKNGLPYGYGGVFSATNPRQSTDCSGVVTAALRMVHGMHPYSRGDGAGIPSISTEAYRYVGPVGSHGPLGTIKTTRNQMPADAAIKIGLQHGYGGGANSHMACTIDGIAFESRGTPGVLFGGTARHWNNSLFHDFFYFPGPIVGSIDINAFPLPSGYYFGPYDGPENSISGLANENPSWISGLRHFQSKVGAPQSGVWDEATKQAAIALQIPAGYLPDGKIGPLTWAEAMKRGGTVGTFDTRIGKLDTDQGIAKLIDELAFGGYESLWDVRNGVPAAQRFKASLPRYILEADYKLELVRADNAKLIGKVDELTRLVTALAVSANVDTAPLPTQDTH